MKKKNYIKQLFMQLNKKAYFALLLIANLFLISSSVKAQLNTGFLNPTTSTNLNSVTNVANALTSNNQYAVFDANADAAKYGGFSLTTADGGVIPVGAAIIGIEVQLEGNRSGSTSTPRNLDISLSWNNGTNYSAAQTLPQFGSSDANRTVGGSSNLWGRTWTVTELANANFAVRCLVSNAATNDINVDLIQVRVYYCTSYSISSTSATTPICSSPGTSSVTVTASPTSGLPTGAYTVTYDRSSPAATGLTAAMTVTTAGSGTFTATGLTTVGNATITVKNIASGGCSNTITSGNLSNTISVGATATVGAGIDQTVCSSSPAVTLAGSIGGSASNATWSGGAGTFSPNNTTLNATYNPSAAEITAGTVTLTLTTDDPAGACNAVSDQMVVTINLAASANAGVDQAVCSTSTVTLAGSRSGTGVTSSAWTGGTGTYNPNNNALNAVYTPSAAEKTAGTVTLILTTNDPAGPCGVATDNMVITINPAATVNAGIDQTVCSFTPAVTLAGSFAGGASNATWSGGGTFNPNNSTLNAVYTPSAAEITAGTATLTLTTNDPSGPCGVVSDQIAVTIKASPTSLSVSPSSSNRCSNATSVALTGAATVSGSATVPSGTENFNATVSYAAVEISGSGQVNDNWTPRGNGSTVVSQTFTTPDGSSFMLTDNGAASGTSTENSTLTSPVINTTNYASITLSYQHTYGRATAFGGTSSGSGQIQISTDGGSTWPTTIKNYTTNQGSSSTFVADNAILSAAFLNQTNLKIRFIFSSTTNGLASGWWGLDNVLINGTPLPLFSWTANTGAGVNGLPANAGTPLASNKNITVVPTATTTYTMTAVNQVTGCTATSTSSVTVHATPVTAITSANTSICPGNSTNITGTVTVEASDNWNVFLTDDGNAPTASGIGSGSFSIPVNPSSTITYSVIQAETDFCETTSGTGSTAVTLLSVPSVSNPSSAVKCEGQAVTFSVTASGNPAPTYQWRKGGVDISGATSASLTIPSVAVGDAGSYDVVVTNSCNAATSNAASLTVNTAPTVSNPVSAVKCLGESVTFSVTSTGTPAPSYQWRKGGVNISGATSASLTFGSIVSSDAASYDVVVTNSCNVATSNAASLSLNISPSVTVQPAVSQTVCAQSSVSLSVTGSATGIAYQWYKGVNPLSDGVNILGATTSTLTLSPVQTTDAASDYHCVVSGTCSPSASSNNAELIVPSETALTGKSITSITDLSNTALNSTCAGQVIQFKANGIAGFPGLQYSWTKASNSLPMEFSNDGLTGWNTGPHITSGNTVYVRFGAVIAGQSAYRLCAVAFTPCQTTAKFTQWMRGTVSGPSFLNGPTVVCSGDTKTYTCGTSTGATQYIWTFSIPGAVFTGQGTQSVGVTLPSYTTGQLCVTAQLDCGPTSASAPKCVSLTQQIGGLSKIAGAASACPGTTGIYSVPLLNGATSYTWNVPAGASYTAISALGDSVSVTFPNPYSSNPALCVTANGQCSAPVSRCTNIATSTPTTPGNITGPSANVCGSFSTVHYSIPTVAGASNYTWTYPVTGGGNATVTTTNAISFTAPEPPFTSGIVSVVANNTACAVGGTGPAKSITVKGVPAKPSSITSGGTPPCNEMPNIFTANYLTPVSGVNYNWNTSFGSSAIELPNPSPSGNAVITWPAGGTYIVYVYASNDCGISGTTTQSFTGIDCSRHQASEDNAAVDNFASNYAVYPNPAHDKLTVSIDGKGNDTYSVSLMDVAGRMIISENVQAAEGSNNYTLDVSKFPKGIYMLQVVSGNDNRKTKVVIE